MTSADESVLRAFHLDELLTYPFKPREKLLAPWILTQSLSMIYAWRGQGKTHVALGLAFALASGGKFLHWSATRPSSVLYIDGEMPGEELRGRLATIVMNSETQPESDYLRFITPDLVPTGLMPNLSTSQGQLLIEPLLEQVEVIIVDNISCLCRSGKENDADSWDMASSWALRMRASGKSVIFIHHSGKTGQQRGTSRREDILDTVINLRAPADYSPSQGARFEIHFEKARFLHGQDVIPVEAHLQSDGSWQTTVVKESDSAVAIEMAEQGYTQTEIARELNVNKSTICRLLKKAQQDGRYKQQSTETPDRPTN